jgi:hypothetical protein
MPYRKYGAKRDGNESDIVKALRMIPGLSVVLINAKDVPDLLVGYLGDNYLFELKNKKGLNKVSEGQETFIDNWKGQTAVVHTLGDILQVLGITF